MFDFTEAFREGIFSGVSSGFNILWQTFRTHPSLVFLFAFILFGNIAVKKMKKHHNRH